VVLADAPVAREAIRTVAAAIVSVFLMRTLLEERMDRRVVRPAPTGTRGWRMTGPDP
jgi:hypothetical protein